MQVPLADVAELHTDRESRTWPMAYLNAKRTRANATASRTKKRPRPIGDAQPCQAPTTGSTSECGSWRCSLMGSLLIDLCMALRMRAMGFGPPLGDPAAVNNHGEDVRDDEDADTPGKGDPDVGADGLLCEQVADRIDDGRHWLVLGEGAYWAGHRVRRHECRADERQKDERVGECARAVHGLRGQTGDYSHPRQRQG